MNRYVGWLAIIFVLSQSSLQSAELASSRGKLGLRLSAIVLDNLENRGLNKFKLDHGNSTAFLDYIFTKLDPDRIVLLQSDIDEFQNKFGKNLGNIIRDRKSDPFGPLLNRAIARTNEMLETVKTWATVPQVMPVSSIEDVFVPRAGIWFASRNQRDEYWRKRLRLEQLYKEFSPASTPRPTSILAQVSKLHQQLQMKPWEANQFFNQALSEFFDRGSEFQIPKSLPNRLPEERENLVKIGLEVSADKNGQLRVSNVLVGSSAEAAGLKINDEIVEIERIYPRTADFQNRLDPLGALIQQTCSASFYLSYVRVDRSRPGQSIFIRERLTFENHQVSAMIVNTIEGFRAGIIVIPAFYEQSSADIVSLISKLEEAYDTDALFLDFRNSIDTPSAEWKKLANYFVGGDLPLLSMTSVHPFLKKEAIKIPKPDVWQRFGKFILGGDEPRPLRMVQIESFGGSPIPETREAPKKFPFKGRTFFLVSPQTTGSAELFVAALQDRGLGLVIGGPRPTRGDVGEYFRDRIQPDIGSRNFFIGTPIAVHSFKVSTFTHLDGRPLDGLGVTPDIAIPTEAGLQRTITPTVIPLDESGFQKWLKEQESRLSDKMPTGTTEEHLSQIFFLSSNELKEGKKFEAMKDADQKAFATDNFLIEALRKAQNYLRLTPQPE